MQDSKQHIDEVVAELADAAKLPADRQVNPWPAVEQVSEIEIWLLDDYGNRIRRVCGAQRPGQPKGRICLSPAGLKTVHNGLGRCLKHEPRGLVLDRQFRAMTLEASELPEEHPFRLLVQEVAERNQRIDLTLPIPELHSLYVLKEWRRRRLQELGHMDTDDVMVFNRAVDKLREDDVAIAGIKEMIGKMRQSANVITLEHLDALFAVLRTWVMELCPTPVVRDVMLVRLSQMQFTNTGVALLPEGREVAV